MYGHRDATLASVYGPRGSARRSSRGAGATPQSAGGGGGPSSSRAPGPPPAPAPPRKHRRLSGIWQEVAAEGLFAEYAARNDGAGRSGGAVAGAAYAVARAVGGVAARARRLSSMVGRVSIVVVGGTGGGGGDLSGEGAEGGDASPRAASRRPRPTALRGSASASSARSGVGAERTGRLSMTRIRSFGDDGGDDARRELGARSPATATDHDGGGGGDGGPDFAPPRRGSVAHAPAHLTRLSSSAAVSSQVDADGFAAAFAPTRASQAAAADVDDVGVARVRTSVAAAADVDAQADDDQRAAADARSSALRLPAELDAEDLATPSHSDGDAAPPAEAAAAAAAQPGFLRPRRRLSTLVSFATGGMMGGAGAGAAAAAAQKEQRDASGGARRPRRVSAIGAAGGAVLSGTSAAAAAAAMEAAEAAELAPAPAQRSRRLSAFLGGGFAADGADGSAAGGSSFARDASPDAPRRARRLSAFGGASFGGGGGGGAQGAFRVSEIPAFRGRVSSAAAADVGADDAATALEADSPRAGAGLAWLRGGGGDAKVPQIPAFDSMRLPPLHRPRERRVSTLAADTAFASDGAPPPAAARRFARASSVLAGARSGRESITMAAYEPDASDPPPRRAQRVSHSAMAEAKATPRPAGAASSSPPKRRVRSMLADGGAAASVAATAALAQADVLRAAAGGASGRRDSQQRGGRLRGMDA